MASGVLLKIQCTQPKAHVTTHGIQQLVLLLVKAALQMYMYMHSAAIIKK